MDNNEDSTRRKFLGDAGGWLTATVLAPALFAGVKMASNHIRDKYPERYGSRTGIQSETRQEPVMEERLHTLEKTVSEPILRNLGRFTDPVYHMHDSTIIRHTSWINEQLQHLPGYTPLDPLLVKAIIMKESGSPKNRQAYLHDPMQIANKWDYGLQTLQFSEIYERLGIDDKSEDFQKFTQTRGRNYNGQNIIDADHSILGGIIYLARKRMKYNEWAEPIGARTWKEAVQKYNGNGTRGHADQVMEILQS